MLQKYHSRTLQRFASAEKPIASYKPTVTQGLLQEINRYSEIQIIHDAPAKAGLPTIETTQKILMQLDEDSAFGPDLLPTRILKRCAAVIAPVLHALVLLILNVGEWPAIWMVH